VDSLAVWAVLHKCICLGVQAEVADLDPSRGTGEALARAWEVCQWGVVGPRSYLLGSCLGLGLLLAEGTEEHRLGPGRALPDLVPGQVLQVAVECSYQFQGIGNRIRLQRREGREEGGS